MTFSTHAELRKRQGKSGTPRLEYLQSLVAEYQKAKAPSQKQEIIAQLANFGYDPINYEAFKKLSIADLFIDALDDKDTTVREFALAGICNCCPDPQISTELSDSSVLRLISRDLASANHEVVLNAMLIFIQLIDVAGVRDFLNAGGSTTISRYTSAADSRLKHAATLLLDLLSSTPT